MGRDDQFFDLLEAGADEAKTSVEHFAAMLQKIAEGSPSTLSLDDFGEARRNEKRIRQRTTEALSKTFVTPLEREDIEALSFALYRIPKQVEKIAERLSIYPGVIPHAYFVRQAELMLQAAEAVAFMVRELRRGTNIERIHEANDRLQFAEAEADKVMLSLLQTLYRGPHDAREVAILQELFEMVERAVDRCRNAGNIVLQVVLKNS